MNKEKIKQIITSKAGVAVITGFLCFSVGGVIGLSNASVDEEYKAEMEVFKEKTQKEIEAAQNETVEASNEATEAKNNLENIKKETQEFYNLDSTDREVAKKYMVELKNKSEEEKKAEQERLKAEEEAKAKAEAEAKAKAEAEAKAKKEAEEKAKKEAEKNKYKTGITFEDLARKPEENMFKLVTFKGEILQVMKGDDYYQYRMAIDSDYDKVVLIEIDKSLLTNGNILEDDIITIRGTFLMEQTYTTVRGDERTIPAIVVDEVDY